MLDRETPVPPEDPGGPFLYFAYGSNMDLERLQMHCPSARLVTIAELFGYRLAFSRESTNWRGGVADVRSSTDAAVWGGLWLIDPAESHALDEQEGLFREPPAYQRIRVDVVTPAGDTVSCRSYQVVDPDDEGFLPSPAYKETLLRGAGALGLPVAYVALLDALEDNGQDGGAPD
jgi:gamma-glutamylcyclotransferase (GGCT)/AIG2-like uncharacterized protein YtfP